MLTEERKEVVRRSSERGHGRSSECNTPCRICRAKCINVSAFLRHVGCIAPCVDLCSTETVFDFILGRPAKLQRPAVERILSLDFMNFLIL